MSECEKYRNNIEDILRKSDLSTVTTKKVRHALESETGISLNPIKKEINSFIENIFTNFQEKEEQRKKYVATPTKIATPKKSPAKVAKPAKAAKPSKVTKKVVTKRKAAKEKKPREWPIYIVNAPLSDMIQTKVCTRPQTVKKIWEYIRSHKLQGEADKRVIHCDELFKEICDGQDTITAFSLNKYIQKYFENIPSEEQEKYKSLYKEQEERLNGSTVDDDSS